MKKFFLISYAFPPKNVVGALRPYRLCRYLPSYGWLPTVITARIVTGSADQSTLRREIPDHVVINETPPWDLARAAGNFLRQFKRQNKRSGTPLQISLDQLQYEKTAPRSTAKKFKHMLSEIIGTPDNNIFWGISILGRGYQCLLSEPGQYRAIVTTSPPHSSQIFGCLLAKFFRIPHIMDLRDPWIDIYRGYQTPWRRRIEQAMEAIAIRWSARIISSTEMYTELLRSRYWHLAPERFQTITNSYEEEKFDAIQGQDLQKFTMAYLGIFYPRRNPYCFFKALNAWLRKHPQNRNQVELRIIGGSDQSTDAMIRKENLSSVVRITGRLPHAEAIRNAKSADLLLLLMGTGDDTPTGWVPSKLYEYLACRKPILANIAEGQASEIIRQTKSGFIVPIDDPDEIVEILEQEFKRKMRENERIPPFDPDEKAIRKFGTRETTRQFAELFNSINK